MQVPLIKMILGPLVDQGLTLDAKLDRLIALNERIVFLLQRIATDQSRLPPT
jgi:hypothetical protein